MVLAARETVRAVVAVTANKFGSPEAQTVVAGAVVVPVGAVTVAPLVIARVLTRMLLLVV